MLTVRAGSKKRFFTRRDVRLIRRRTFKRPQSAGTRAHVLHERAKKILSNETKNSSRSFYLRVVVRGCLLYMPTHKRTNASFIFSRPPFYLFFSRSRGSYVGVGFFSLAVICRPRARFEILSFVFLFRSSRFLGVKRERERFTHTKKNGRRKKKQIATLNIFFFVCLFVSAVTKLTLPPSGTFSARHETPSQNRERPYSSREEEEEEDKEDKEEEKKS